MWELFQGEFRLQSISGREPQGGFAGKQQGLHPDYWGKSYDPAVGGPARSADSTWMLDDFTRENGTTRLVPRSHRRPGRPEDSMQDTSEDHPDQIVVEAPAGSVLIFNGHVWHAGSLNRSGARRRGIFPYMQVVPEWDRGAYQRDRLLKRTWDSLPTEVAYLLFGNEEP